VCHSSFYLWFERVNIVSLLKMVNKVLVIALFACLCTCIATCPSTISINNDRTRGSYAPIYDEDNNVNITALALQFDSNCHGLHTYPPGTNVYTAQDNAQLVLFKGECLVANLSCGVANPITGTNVTSDTLVNTYSCAKHLTGLALIMLEDSDRFAWDEKVSTYWPAFGQNGKEDITVEQLFSNHAGLFYISAVTLADISLFSNFSRLRTVLETQAPNIAPGTCYGYVPVVRDWYAQFFVAAVDAYNRTLTEFISQEIGVPTGTDFNYGFNYNMTDLVARLGLIRPGVFPIGTLPSSQALSANLADPNSLQYKSIYNPIDFLNPFIINTPAGIETIVPAGTLYTTAYDLAKSSVPFTLMGHGSISLASKDAIKLGTHTVYNGTDCSTFGQSSYSRNGDEKNAILSIFSPDNKVFVLSSYSHSLSQVIWS